MRAIGKPSRQLLFSGHGSTPASGSDPSDLLYFIRLSHPQYFQGPSYQFRVNPVGGYQAKLVNDGRNGGTTEDFTSPSGKQSQ